MRSRPTLFQAAGRKGATAVVRAGRDRVAVDMEILARPGAVGREAQLVRWSGQWIVPLRSGRVKDGASSRNGQPWVGSPRWSADFTAKTQRAHSTRVHQIDKQLFASFASLR